MRVHGPEPSVRSFFDRDERLAVNKRSSGHAGFREDPTDILNVPCEDPGEDCLDDCLSDAGRLHAVALGDRRLKGPSRGSRSPSATLPRGLRAFSCSAPIDGRCGSRSSTMTGLLACLLLWKLGMMSRTVSSRALRRRRAPTYR